MGAVLAYEIPSFYLGVIQANKDMSNLGTYQYTAVKVAAASGSGLSGVALDSPASGAAAVGILQNNPGLGEVGQVMVHGVSKAKLSGTVAEGALLATDASGLLKTAATGDFAIAQALSSGVSGDVIPVLLVRNGKQ